MLMKNSSHNRRNEYVDSLKMVRMKYEKENKKASAMCRSLLREG